MGRVAYTHQAFNAGELGRFLYGRIEDVAAYRRGCRTLKNFDIAPQGPAIKRKGTWHVAETKNSANQSRLIPFVFSEQDSFLLEFGDSYIRFYSNQSPVYEAAVTITSATAANPVVVTATIHGYSNGDEVLIEGVSGQTELNGKRFIVANVTTNTFELTSEDGSARSAGTGGTAQRVYEITSPYGTSDLPNIKFTQKNDIMYLAAGGTSIRPQKLTRINATNWTIAAVDNQLGPVEDVNDSATTITLTGTISKGGTSTWTASASLFETAHVGSVWAIANTSNANIGYARMTARSSATVATFENQTALFATSTATTNWYAASWSGVNGYPKAVAFHQGRLFWGGVDNNPLGMYGSVSADNFENYDKDDASDEDAVRFSLNGQRNDIQWIVSDGDFITAGTAGGLAFVSGGTDGVITPSSITARVGTSFGSSNVQGVKFNNTLKYIQGTGRVMYEAQYDDVALNYVARDISVFNNNILEDGVSYMSVRETPFTSIYAVAGDGECKVVTQENVQTVLGWSRYVTGEDVSDAIESVAIVAGQKYDEVWFIVKRTIDGNTVRYVEYVEPDIDVNYFVDSGMQYTGAATDTITGLDYLEGRIVHVYDITNKLYEGEYTVSSGSITLNAGRTVTNAYIGIPYNADLEIMRPEAGGNNGFALGKLQRTHRFNLLLYNTQTFQAGPSFSKLQTVPTGTTTNTILGSGPAVVGATDPDFLPEDVLLYEGAYTRNESFCIRSGQPYPITVIAAVLHLETNDG